MAEYLFYATPENAACAPTPLAWQTSIEDFVREARECLARDETLVVEMQPGDATHYKFLIVPYVDPLTTARVILAGHNAYANYALDDPIPEPTHSPFYGLNPYTAAVFADVLGAVAFGVEPGLHYDWAGSKLTGPYVVRAGEES